MSDGVKLASGYIELTIKSAGGAMKDITAAITGVEKQAEKSGQQAGKALNDGISKGAKSAGKAVRDEITAGAEKAGADAGKKAGDALEKGVTAGAKRAGKGAGAELDKGVSDAAKRTGKKAGDSIGGAIVESVRQGAKSAGWSLEDLMQESAKKAGRAIGNAIGDSPLGDWVKSLGVDGEQAVTAIDGIGTAITGIKEKDLGSALSGISQALTGIGQSDAGDALGQIAKSTSSVMDIFTQTKGAVSEVSTLFQGFTSNASGIAGGLGSIATAAGSLAGPFAAAAAAGVELGQALQKIGDEEERKAFAALNDKDRQTYLSHGLTPQAPIQPQTSPYNVPQVPPTKQEAQKGLDLVLPPGLRLPGQAKGGVTPAGQIYGPGTGTSDSIIGVGADGVPTARVSTGEGVVRKSAMDKGGAQVVAALNAGLKLPGYDDGTTNVGGPPIPMPEAPPIQVPEATTGAAGQLNDFLNSSQGKAYEYGTLYDCSGFMSQIYNKMTGKQMPRFNTESDLAAYGFVRGSKPGEFNLGIHHGGGGPNSHMAGTLPDGRAVESSSNGVQIGTPLAHGANDKQFEDHWFLPGSGGMAGLGASITGTPADAPATGDAGGKEQRTEGYIPAGAGGSGQAGTSFASGALQMGAQAVNGLIEQAGSAAATAVSAAATAGSFGAGGQAAGPASSFLIGIGTKMAERGVKYGFQMAGIGIDSLAEIMSPFGVPRFFQTSPTQFMPQLPGKPAATTTGEKAEQAQDNPQAAQAAGIDPSGPVQPGQMPGQQPVAAPAPIATPGTGDFKPAPTPVGPALSGPTAPAVATPQAPAAPVQGPQPGTPPAAPTPKQSSSVDQLLSGLYGGIVPGLARGGVVPSLFDDGGWLMPNGVAINKTNRPEPILNDEQFSNLHAIASQGMPEPDPQAYSGGGGDYSMTFNEGAIVVKDVEQMQRELDSRQRLQRMRYGGRP